MPESLLSEKKSATPVTGLQEKKSTEKPAQKKSAKKESVVMFCFCPWLLLT